eukprot:3281665-Rhodomonas_salina.1
MPCPSQSWKDHPFPDLHGAPTGETFEGHKTYLMPTNAEYQSWMATLHKTLRALSLLWVIPLALGMEFVNCNYNPFVPGQEDYPDDQAFQWIVVQVALAIDAGTLQALPKIDNPLQDAHHCAKNF